MTRQWIPVTDRSAWQPKDLEKDRSWQFEVTLDQAEELDRALEGVKARRLTFGEIRKEDFPLPSLAETLQDVLLEIRDGRGIATLSKVPVEYPYEDLERLYWGLCSHLGTGVTQNLETGLIHYITDGELAPKNGARILGKPGPVKLHVDLTDCVGLFCIQQAPDDPKSMAASSMTVYNEILRSHPEYLTRLEEGYFWTRKGPHPSEKLHSEFRVPAWSIADGTVTCRFHAGWIRSGMKSAGVELSDAEVEMFDFIAETAAANAYAFTLRPGMIAFWNNYTTFHGRDGHAEIEEESKKRVLLRVWLDLPDVRPFSDEARIRYGAVRHGQLGWTAEEVLAGENRRPHLRHADGVPAI